MLVCKHLVGNGNRDKATLRLTHSQTSHVSPNPIEKQNLCRATATTMLEKLWVPLVVEMTERGISLPPWWWSTQNARYERIVLTPIPTKGVWGRGDNSENKAMPKCTMNISDFKKRLHFHFQLCFKQFEMSRCSLPPACFMNVRRIVLAGVSSCECGTDSHRLWYVLNCLHYSWAKKDTR